jgi:hypothetical protein
MKKNLILIITTKFDIFKTNSVVFRDMSSETKKEILKDFSFWRFNYGWYDSIEYQKDCFKTDEKIIQN